MRVVEEMLIHSVSQQKLSEHRPTVHNSQNSPSLTELTLWLPPSMASISWMQQLEK